MNAGVVFTEKYLKLMFKSLRDATPEEVMEELEHCRRENRRPVRIPRYFRGFFVEDEKFRASTGFEMQVFRHIDERSSALRPSTNSGLRDLKSANSSSIFTVVPSSTRPYSSIGVSCTTSPFAPIAMP